MFKKVLLSSFSVFQLFEKNLKSILDGLLHLLHFEFHNTVTKQHNLFIYFLFLTPKQTDIRTFNTTRRHASSGEDTEKLTKRLFTNLTNDMIEKLYKFYHIDFEMFQYEYKDFLHQKNELLMLSLNVDIGRISYQTFFKTFQNS